jgi:hypothetical protein
LKERERESAFMWFTLINFRQSLGASLGISGRSPFVTRSGILNASTCSKGVCRVSNSHKMIPEVKKKINEFHEFVQLIKVVRFIFQKYSMSERMKK